MNEVLIAFVFLLKKTLRSLLQSVSKVKPKSSKIGKNRSYANHRTTDWQPRKSKLDLLMLMFGFYGHQQPLWKLTWKIPDSALMGT